jgi:hypothetical protein
LLCFVIIVKGSKAFTAFKPKNDPEISLYYQNLGKWLAIEQKDVKRWLS